MSFDTERKATPTATQGLYRDYAGAPGYQNYTRNSQDARESSRLAIPTWDVSIWRRSMSTLTGILAVSGVVLVSRSPCVVPIQSLCSSRRCLSFSVKRCPLYVKRCPPYVKRCPPKRHSRDISPWGKGHTCEGGRGSLVPRPTRKNGPVSTVNEIISRYFMT